MNKARFLEVNSYPETCVYLAFIGNLLYVFDCTAVSARQLKQNPSFSSKESKIYAVI